MRRFAGKLQVHVVVVTCKRLKVNSSLDGKILRFGIAVFGIDIEESYRRILLALLAHSFG